MSLVETRNSDHLPSRHEFFTFSLLLYLRQTWANILNQKSTSLLILRQHFLLIFYFSKMASSPHLFRLFGLLVIWCSVLFFLYLYSYPCLNLIRVEVLHLLIFPFLLPILFPICLIGDENAVGLSILVVFFLFSNECMRGFWVYYI